MPDTLTLLVLRWLVKPLASLIRRIANFVGWFNHVCETVEFEVIFEDWEVFGRRNASQSMRPRWLVRWLCKAYRLQKAANSRRVAGKLSSGL